MERQGNDLEAYRHALEEEKLNSSKPKQTSAFAGFAVESDSESDEEEKVI